MDWAAYALHIEATTKFGSTVSNVRRFAIRARIFNKVVVSMSQTSSNQVNGDYQYDDEWPVQFESLNTNDFPYLHAQVMTQFEGDKDMVDHPSSVYLTLQKENQVIYSVHADYVPAIKRYQIFANLKNLMPQRINGDYNVVLHVTDPRVDEPLVKELGNVQIDFNEGSHDRVYDNVRDDYRLYDHITNYFPPEPEAKGATIPLIFSGILVVGFLVFCSSVFSNHANLNNISVGGLVFIVNYLAIYVVIIAFWIEINLVNTLWILLGLAPITLGTMHMGLTKEGCEVSAFKKSKGKQE